MTNGTIPDFLPLTQSRRRFIGNTAAAFGALVASGCTMARPVTVPGNAEYYGALVPDPAGLLDLPRGFDYRVISRLGDPMNDGERVPDKADGMGCLQLPGDRLVLVRNHELTLGDEAGGALASGYGKDEDGRVLPGGTTNIVLDASTLAVERQFRTLAGTIRNCAGGVTPWNSWLTCEEPGGRLLPTAIDHGYVFEIPATATGLVDPVPLKALGRFNHEAACVDPATGIVYQTEDRDDGVLYRFLPRTPGQLADGGRLQALVLTSGLNDSRNWEAPAMAVGDSHEVRWIDMDDVEAPRDDLRLRAAAGGALLIARGEGIHWGRDELYICSTSGGAAKVGQIFKLIPGRDGAPDRLELFFESTSPDQFDYGDNLTVAPNGHLIVCEDQGGMIVDNYLRGITPDGRAYAIGRLRTQTELAGACFSPDGKWLFVNAYSPTATLAITGPW